MNGGFVTLNRFNYQMNVTKYLFSSLQSKLTLAFIVLVAAPLIALGIASLRATSNIIQTNAEAGFATSTGDEAEKMQSFLTRAEGDAVLLARTPGLNQLINSTDPHLWHESRAQLADFFRSFSSNHLFYEEISYIDETGQQIIKVSSDGQRTWVVSDDKLQNKAGEYYFSETMKLESGQVFVSQLDLDREFGNIVRPFKPVIRQSTPVFDQQGRRRGIVVLFILGSKFLPAIDPDYSESGGVEFMVDQDGYYLIHSDFARAWSGPLNLNTGYNLHADYPADIAEAILSGDTGLISEGVDSIVTHAPVFPDPAHPEHYWVMVDIHPKSAVLAPVAQFRNLFVGVLAGTLVAASLLSLVISRWLSRPLVELRQGVQVIGQGNLDHRLTLSTGDEIEALANDFNLMAERLQESYSGLEQKVAERTAELTALNAIAFTVNSSLDLEADLEQALEIIKQELNLDFAWIFLAQDNSQHLHLAAASGLPDEFLRGEARRPVTRCNCGQVLDTGEFCHVQNDSCRRLQLYRQKYPHLPADHVSVPVFSKQSVVGVLNLGSSNGTNLSADDYRWLETVARQIGNAVENAALYQNTLKEADRMAALNRVSTTVSVSWQLDNVLYPLLSEMAGVLGMNQGVVVLKSNDRRGRYKLRAFFGRWQPETDLNNIAWQTLPLLENLERTHAPVYINDAAGSKWLDSLHGLIAREGIQTVLALPLVVQQQLIGFIQLHSVNHTRIFETEEIELAKTLTNQAAVAIEKARLYEATVARYEEEQQMARQIQQNLLPRNVPRIPGLQIAGLCRPAQATGGDFFDYIPLPGNKLGVVVGDVTGKSLPAAMVMALARNTIRAETLSLVWPNLVMTAANQMLSEDIRRGTFVATVSALLDPTNKKLLLVNAGQTATLLHRNNQIQFLLPDEAAGLPLGIQPDIIYSQAEIDLLPGDTLLFYTDGIVEAKNSSGDMFGFDRLETVLQSIPPNAPAETVLHGLLADMEKFVGGAEQHDDITLVVVQIK
ncbi:MAG: GAF domain-containing protein [Chloroflexi bacterium]|nr:MAG: GAF domain-containing protein [Chloroflexota bacterium]